MSANIDVRVKSAKEALAQLEPNLARLEKQRKELTQLLITRAPITGSGIKIEVKEKRKRERASWQKSINQLTPVINELKSQIEGHKSFLSLQSELDRTLATNRGLQAAQDLPGITSRDKQQLSAESRRILAEFERAKTQRVDSNNAAKLQEQLAIEQGKAAKVLEGILNPALFERERKEAQLAANTAGFNAQAALARQEQERRLAEKARKDLEELQARFGNLPIDQFLEQQRELKKAENEAELAAAKAQDEFDGLKRIDEAKDKNAAIKNFFDDFIEGAFGIEQPDQSGGISIDESKLAGAYAQSQNVEVDDIVEAHEIQTQAANEVKALLEARSR